MSTAYEMAHQKWLAARAAFAAAKTRTAKRDAAEDIDFWGSRMAYLGACAKSTEANAKAMSAAPQLLSAAPQLLSAAPQLLSALQDANRIIANALAVMTPAQKKKWGEMNDKDDLPGDGVTRRAHRDAIIAKANGAAS